MGITPTAEALKRVSSHSKAQAAWMQPTLRLVSPCFDSHTTYEDSLTRVVRDSAVNHVALEDQKGGVCVHLRVSSKEHIYVSRG